MRIRTFFDRRAKHYEKTFSLPLVKRLEQAEVSRILSVAEVASKSVLDIGCGYGKFSKLWKERGARLVVGMDFSKNMLEQAKKKGNCFFLMGDAFKIPFKEGSFDVITCIGVANYYENVDALLEEICRVATEEVILTFPKNSRIGKIYAKISNINIFLRSEKEITKVCSSYFEPHITECASGLTFVVSGKVDDSKEKDSTAHLQRGE